MSDQCLIEQNNSGITHTQDVMVRLISLGNIISCQLNRLDFNDIIKHVMLALFCLNDDILKYWSSFVTTNYQQPYTFSCNLKISLDIYNLITKTHNVEFTLLSYFYGHVNVYSSPITSAAILAVPAWHETTLLYHNRL